MSALSRSCVTLAVLFVRRFCEIVARHDDAFFLLSFDTSKKLTQWAGELRKDIEVFEIIGNNLVAALGDKVHLCVNFGTKNYKEFPPDEIAQLKAILVKQKNG